MQSKDLLLVPGQTSSACQVILVTAVAGLADIQGIQVQLVQVHLVIVVYLVIQVCLDTVDCLATADILVQAFLVIQVFLVVRVTAASD